MSDVLKYYVIEGAVSESGGLCPSRPYGTTRIRMMNEVTQQTVSLHQQNVTDVLWKVHFQCTAFECELYFFFLFLTPLAVVNMTFDPCGECVGTFPISIQEKSMHRSQSIFLPLPLISITQLKEKKPTGAL